MSLDILTGSSSPRLAEQIARVLGVELTPRILERFPDGELHVQIEKSIRGSQVFLIQPTCLPVDEHLFELFLMADACRRAEAAHLTAIIPYFGYARQDRRARGREPVSTRVVADLLQTSGVQRLVVVDFHSRSVEALFAMPVEHISAVALLAESLRNSLSKHAVVVSPDLGAVKMAEQYGKLLDLPVAIVHKTRLSATEVSVQRIIGEVRQKEILLIDDMITTGVTIEKAITALLEAGCSSSGLKVAATHGLFVGAAAARLAKLPIETIHVSDSVPTPGEIPLALQVSSLAPLLAETIKRLYRSKSLDELLVHG